MVAPSATAGGTVSEIDVDEKYRQSHRGRDHESGGRDHGEPRPERHGRRDPARRRDMPRRRQPARRNEIMSRSVDIASFRASVGLHVDEPRSQDPLIEARPWLELRGTMDEAVRNVREIVFSLYPEENVTAGTARPAAVGSIIQVRPELSIVVRFPHRDFDRVWCLAITGQLKYAYLSFTKPHYSKGLVTSLSFSTERED
jgi:hypothetical protein